MAAERTPKSKLPPGQAMGLANLVEYGEGAIVSRTLVEASTGTVTLFAFDGDQGLSEHTAPFDALMQVVEGQGEFVIGGKACRVAAGQVVLMPANIPHAVRATGRFKMLLTMIRSAAPAS